MAEEPEDSMGRVLMASRRAGQMAKGFAVGMLIVIALIEFYGQIGNLAAFQYQGY